METLAEWGARTLSPSVSRFTLETALQGIYAGDSKQMSASLVLGRFFAPAQKSVVESSEAFRNSHGRSRSSASLRKGTLAAKGGMGQFVSVLNEYLSKRGVVFSEKKLTSLATDNVPTVLAVSLSQAAQLLKETNSDLAHALARIPMLPLLTVTVFFRDNSGVVDGFGVLFPPGEGRLALGILVNTAIFSGRADAGVVSETWILGGARDGDLVRHWSDEQIQKAICAERTLLTGRSVDVLEAHVTRWPQALPHVTTHLEQVWKTYEPVQRHVFLHGNYLGRIGLAQILERSRALPALIQGT